MSDEELTIQISLGTIKWYDLTYTEIFVIESVELINLLFQLSCEPLTDVHIMYKAIEPGHLIKRRKIELTGNLI